MESNLQSREGEGDILRNSWTFDAGGLGKVMNTNVLAIQWLPDSWH